MSERVYWLGWQMLLPGWAKRIWDLVERFGSPRTAWEATPRELETLGGFSESAALELNSRRRAVNPELALEKMSEKGIEYIQYHDKNYPCQLKNIYDPPPGIFARGKMRSEDYLAVAMVGSRRPTPYGLAVAEKLALDVARAGMAVVSGMARGIDTMAHRGALKAGGYTLAVLGCGVDVVYPRENRSIMEEIAQSGAVISEFPPGSAPEAWHFPVRNRIISGLSRCVVVVEAAERSGALITADLALEQGRDVMAVPGNVTSQMSRGPNNLIKQGARLVERAEDIFEELGITSLFKTESREKSPGVKLSEDEKQVLKLLSYESLNLDIIIQQSGLTSQQVLAALMFLEIKGVVRQQPGKNYVLRQV